jgi:hypothetical protein
MTTLRPELQIAAYRLPTAVARAVKAHLLQLLVRMLLLVPRTVKLAL